MLIAAPAPTLDFHSALLIPLRPGVGTTTVYLGELETFGLINVALFFPPPLDFFFTSVSIFTRRSVNVLQTICFATA